ncbi:acyl-CoA synthetase [Burkholderia cenocepacia]|uniref:acyl-CoA synthetase n=1 Tax=Burkholderia cenocepacia TaxID=95486 RepID=UPI002862AFF3|nr:acyl-CoA synthetase [Burkholderia cenocepacia]MDR8071891.1 acyl-CoA synthetase [Burkholderia cenocepacia]
MSLASVANLAQLLRQSARQFPHRPAVVHRDQTWTWSEIDGRVDAMVSALHSLGVRPGDKILVHSRNCVQMFESCWVAFRLGAVWVPTNFRLTPPEVAYLGSSSGSCVMIVDEEYITYADAVQAESPDLRHVVVIGSPRQGEHSYEDLVAANLGATVEDAAVEYDTPAWFFYTSGTTGRPKAAILTHGQMAFVVANHLADVIPGTTELDCSIVVAPLSHGAGIHGLLNVARGAAAVILPSEKMDPEMVWGLVEKHKVSNFFAVPTIIKMLVEHPAVDRYDHSSLRYINYGGAPMYRADQKLALIKLGRVLVQHFGLGEATACITVLPPHMHSAEDDDPAANIGSCGRPRTGMEVVIMDPDLNKLPVGEVGEICCRGPAVFAGYYGNHEATEKAFRGGWFHTGDLGRLDERGLLYITGRESDMYISGGSNVYPREVEEILLTHQSVAEVAVLGIPDPKWGEVGVAVIALRNDCPPIDATELLRHLEGRCARYRWPKYFFFWDALPKSGYGKITKKEVRQMLYEREASLFEVNL